MEREYLGHGLTAVRRTTCCRLGLWHVYDSEGRETKVGNGLAFARLRDLRMAVKRNFRKIATIAACLLAVCILDRPATANEDLTLKPGDTLTINLEGSDNYALEISVKAVPKVAAPIQEPVNTASEPVYETVYVTEYRTICTNGVCRQVPVQRAVRRLVNRTATAARNVASYVSPPGFHRHVLTDGTVIEHHDSNFGSAAAHVGVTSWGGSTWTKYTGTAAPGDVVTMERSRTVSRTYAANRPRVLGWFRNWRVARRAARAAWYW